MAERGRPLVWIACGLCGLLTLYRTLGTVFGGEGQQESRVLQVVFFKPGPKWDKTLDFEKQLGMEVHLKRIDELYRENLAVLSGQFERGFGMVVALNTRTEIHARKLIESDTAVSSGLLIAEFHTWTVSLSHAQWDTSPPPSPVPLGPQMDDGCGK
jgi:hypothetical protein